MVRFLLASAIGFVAATPAMAVVIKPTGATASSTFSSGYLPSFTIDGSGLSNGGFDPAEAHATYVPGNHWTTAAGTNPVGQFIDWTFAAPTTLGAAYLWNHRSDGVAANAGYEPVRFTLTMFDAGGTALRTLANVALLPDTATAQRIDFALTDAVSRVRFEVLETQSSTTYTGLAEVAFDTQSFAGGVVPEPTTWAMMIGGVAAAGGALRRRKANVSVRYA